MTNFGAVDGNEWPRIVLLLSGLGQDGGRVTGLDRLNYKLEVAKCTNRIKPDTLIQRRSWRVNAFDIAQTLDELGAEHCEYTLIGFSKGGATADAVADELWALGRATERGFLIDPVGWLGFGTEMEGSIGFNNLWSWTQETGYPFGSPIVANARTTHRLKQSGCQKRHTEMDDLSEIHYIILQELCNG